MVVAADHQIAQTMGRRTGDGLMLASVDRAREFRRARQRSRVVRALRVVLPVTAVGLLGAYALSIAQTSGVVGPDTLPELSIRKVLPTDLVMKNPRAMKGSTTMAAVTSSPPRRRSRTFSSRTSSR